MSGENQNDEVAAEAAASLKRLTDELHFAEQAFKVRMINLDHEHRAKVHAEDKRFSAYKRKTQAEIDAVKSVLESVPKSSSVKTPQSGRSIEDHFNEYATIVENSDLSATSKSIYIDFANCFVRWTQGQFQPGKVGAWKRPKYSRKKGNAK